MIPEPWATNPWIGVLTAGVLIVDVFVIITIRAYVEGWKRRNDS